MNLKHIKLSPLFIIFSAISILITCCFPLITQFYIDYAYHQTVSFLLITTLAFSLLFVCKIGIDVYLEKRKAKFFQKLEKSIKEQVFEKYKNTLTKFLEKKSDILAHHLSYYILYKRTILENTLDWSKIIIVTVILYFFNNSLFIFMMYASPFFLLFFFISKYIAQGEHIDASHEDYSMVLQKASALPEEQARSYVQSHLESQLRKKLHTKRRFIPLTVTMRSFISFFRVWYLAFFGYFAVIGFQDITGLVVGLLYLTLIIRPIIHILETHYVYNITLTSRRKIYALYS